MRRSSSVVGVRNWKRAVSARVCALCALVFTYVRLQAMAVCVQLRVWKRMPHLHECASVCSSPGRLWALIHQITGFRLLVGKKFYNHLLCDNVSVTQVKHSRDLSGLCCVRVWGFLLALAPCTDCCAFLCAWCGSAADVRVNCNSATLRRWNADSEGWRWSESQMFALRCVLREWRRRHHPESNTPRNTWKQSFVQRSRNSEANIFLTWMFLNPISKATAPQRAVCLTQAKHNILCSLSFPHCQWIEPLYVAVEQEPDSSFLWLNGSVWYFSRTWLSLAALTPCPWFSPTLSSCSPGPLMWHIYPLFSVVLFLHTFLRVFTLGHQDPSPIKYLHFTSNSHHFKNEITSSV